MALRQTKTDWPRSPCRECAVIVGQQLRDCRWGARWCELGRDWCRHFFISVLIYEHGNTIWIDFTHLIASNNFPFYAKAWWTDGRMDRQTSGWLLVPSINYTLAFRQVRNDYAVYTASFFADQGSFFWNHEARWNELTALRGESPDVQYVRRSTTWCCNVD